MADANTETRSIVRKVDLEVNRERCFEALIKPKHICNWWSASSAIVLDQQGGLWAATWGDVDQPDYVVIARIAEFRSPERMLLIDFQYRSKDGPLPFDADLHTEYSVSSTSDENTIGCCLEIVQSGFPQTAAADAFFDGCQVGWDNTLRSLADYLHQPGNK